MAVAVAVPDNGSSKPRVSNYYQQSSFRYHSRSTNKRRQHGRPRFPLLRRVFLGFILLPNLLWWIVGFSHQLTDVSNSSIFLDYKHPATYKRHKKSQQPQQHNRRHHAIVIPFRKREKHLQRFIEHMGPYMKRNFPQDDFSLYVMEQADDKLFNRGFLLNAGLTEVNKRMGATHCAIVHDVDLIPQNDGVPYNKCAKPIQLGSELEHWNWTHPYPRNCGGIVSMHMVDWQTINGMSNDYEGWGGEDDDLYERLRRNDLLRNPVRLYAEVPEVMRPPRGNGVFIHLDMREEDTVASSNDTIATTSALPSSSNNETTKETQVWKGHLNPNHHANHDLLKSMYSNSDRWKHDGLSEIDYNVLNDTIIRNAKGADGFFEIHHIKILAQVNYTAQRGGVRRRQHRVGGGARRQERQISYLAQQQPQSFVSRKNGQPEEVQGGQLNGGGGTENQQQQSLEYIHIPHTGGDILEKAAAQAGISWGSCHYKHELLDSTNCPSFGPDLAGRVSITGASQEEASRPWHVPLARFQTDPFGKVPTFMVVRSPYERAIALYFDKSAGYKGEKASDPANLNRFIHDCIRKQGGRRRGGGGSTAIDYLPQNSYLFRSGGRTVTHILHYETLHQEFPALMASFNLRTIDLPEDYYNHSSATQGDLGVNDLTNETLQMINSYAGDDFSLLGYEMKSAQV